MIGDDLIQYLESRGIGILGTDLFLNYQQDSPNNCVTVYDEQAPTLPESSCLSVDNCGIQILVRNNDTVIAKNKIKEIHKILAGFGGGPLVLDGDIVSYIMPSSGPVSIGVDEKSRAEWSSHYVVRVESKSGDENRL